MLYPKLLAGLTAALLLGGGLGCSDPDSSPTIELAATTCPTDQINIDASKTVSGSASNWVVVVTVKVTCGGEPLPEAEFKFTPWIGDAIKLETDQDGMATYRRQVSTTDRPGELTVTVEVEGSDGTKTVPVTV